MKGVKENRRASRNLRRLTKKLDAKDLASLQERRMSWSQEVGDSDLIQSSVLTVESLNDNLKKRYAEDVIYTLCGTILVAVNPYKPISIYSVDIMRQYRSQPIGALPPHVFAVADQSFRDMVESNRSVSTIISGESGAGKTETTKLILNYVSSLHNEQTVVEARLIESASLLEAFGNAKTVRNNNSSRFGKLIKIRFSPGNRICGAEIETYLLERSRVSHRDENERNFHIFYQMTEGFSDEERELYSLDGAAAYRFTQGCIELEGQDEAEELDGLKEGLQLFGFTDDEVHFVFSVVAAILHLGNITFGYDDARQMATLDSKEELEVASALLKVPMKALHKVLVERTIVVQKRTIRKGLTAEGAASTRDALCRTIYGGLFDWIVSKVNASLEPTTKTLDYSFGVLDIFGFENFKVNSLEQLCINYANEKLHALFIEQVFTLEQQEYVSEGLQWTKIDSSDNDECIALIEAKMGILTLLDEESKLASGSDESFMKKMASTFSGKNKCFKPARLDPKSFVVSHFAEQVSYLSEGFRDKNQNTLADDVSGVMAQSEQELVRSIMGPPPQTSKSASGTVRGLNTIGSTFRRQLIALKKTLSATKPFFIRCLKPNTVQKPGVYEEDMVRSQLAYSGMVETVKIRSMGFPYRVEYEALFEKYKPLGLKSASPNEASAMMKRQGFDQDQYAVGSSKLFLKAGAHLELEQRLVVALQKWAIKIQACVRMFMLRRQFERMQDASSIIGYNMRIVLANRHLQQCVVAALAVARACEESRREEAAVRIQLNWISVLENRRLRKCVVAAFVVAQECERLREEERERLWQEEEEERLRLEEEKRRRREAAERKRRQKEEEEEALEIERLALLQHQESELERELEEEQAALEEEKARKKREKALKLQRQKDLLEEEERQEREEAAAAASTLPKPPPTPAGKSKPSLPKKPSSPRRSAPSPPPKRGSSNSNNAPSKPAALPPKPLPSGARFSGGADSSIMSEIDEETQAHIDEVNAMDPPNDPMQTLQAAKNLQRQIKGQPPLIADAMYFKTVEFYRKGLESIDDCDAYINCATALINQANLRSVMEQYHSKSQGCIPLLDLAMRMLERALSLGLDQEGKTAIQLRLRKCEELKEQALQDDADHLSPRHLDKLVQSMQRKLDLIKVQERQGKIKKESAGLMGRTMWKEFILVLGPTRVQWFVKDTKASNAKGEITLAELTAAKETIIQGKPNCFALVGAGGFYPFACRDRAEMEQWVQCISNNMMRLKLLSQIAKLTHRQ